MKAILALCILFAASGCASTYTRVVSDDGRIPPSARVVLPPKPDAECVGEWVWNVTRGQWACISNAPVRAQLSPLRQWLVNPYGPSYGGYTSGYINVCGRRFCFGSSWVR